MRDWMQLLETEILEEEAARENLEARVSALERKLEAQEWYFRWRSTDYITKPGNSVHQRLCGLNEALV